MSETLFPYYERELVMIRRMAQEFAKQYPAAAGRLMLEPNRSGDPHIERLIESFALLAGRIHTKIDDEFPELTDALPCDLGYPDDWIKTTRPATFPPEVRAHPTA